MNRTYEQLLHTKNCKNTYCHDCKCKTSCVSEKHMVSELSGYLLEARELIKEMSQTFLTISQYPIAFVCEDVRTLARNEWEKSKEYAE